MKFLSYSSGAPDPDLEGGSNPRGTRRAFIAPMSANLRDETYLLPGRVHLRPLSLAALGPYLSQSFKSIPFGEVV